MTNSLHRSDKYVTGHNKCSQIPPSTSVHSAIRVLFVLVDLHTSLCRQKHTESEPEICLLYPILFAKFALHPNPQAET